MSSHDNVLRYDMGLRSRLQLVLAIAVGVIGALAFIPAISGGWIFDDHSLIANNPYIHSFADWPRWFVTDFWNVSNELVHFSMRILYWRPGVTASYALDWKLGGGSPVMFHVTNYLLEAVTAALAYTTLRRWLGKTVPALIAAVLFVVHPTKAESVAWIAGRTDILCALALFVATAGAARRRSGRHGGIAMEAAGTIVAYLCKEQAIVLPCFIAVEAWVALDRPALDRAVLGKLVRAALPQAAIAIAYLGARTILMPVGVSGDAGHIALADHALAVLETLGRFAALAVVPHDLSIQQGLVHTEHHELIHSHAYAAVGVLSTLALAFAAWRLRRRAPAVTVGILLYFALLLPTSNVVYTDMVTLISERFLYLPLLGLAFALGGALALADGRSQQRAVAVLAVAAAVLINSSLGRSADYRDENAFWARELELHPDSRIARGEAFKFYARSRRYYDAIALWQGHSPYDAAFDEPLSVAGDVASVMVRLIPDHHAHDLQQVDQFCADVLARRPAHLDLLGVAFAIGPVKSDKAFAESQQGLLMLRADLQSRLGHDAEAIGFAQEAATTCPVCSTLLEGLSLALARGGRYDDANAVLASIQHAPEQGLALLHEQIDAAHELAEQAASEQGPAALQAHASELAKLELWGRAFDVLAPYETDIATAPKFATGFAELAVRAGEPEVARRVLAKTKSPAETDALITDWTAKMGWSR